MLKRLPKDGRNTEVKEMSFLDHLEELRWHIIKALVAIVVCAVVVYVFEEWVFENIVFGPRGAGFLTYEFFCSLSEKTCFQPQSFEVLPREMGEQFFTSLKVSFWLGLVAAFPYVFYQFWSFVKPGLYPDEKKSVKGVVFICSLLFSLGVVFGYFIIAPFAINFLAGYNVASGVTNSTSLSSYVNYMVMFTVPTGILFELPVVVHFLASIGLLTADFMREYRRHALVVILILSAIITPPDVVTQVLISIPVMILYELSIYIARRAEKKREKLLKSL